MTAVSAIALLSVALAAVGRTAAQAPASEDGIFGITHVTVIDVVTGSATKNATVVIRGNRIERIDSKHRAKIPKSAKVIDASGKYLIPGLSDMHVHTFFGTWIPGGREVTLPLFVTNGVTGIRDMGSELDLILAARKDIQEHRQIGPRMIVAGPMLDGPKSQFPASIAIATPEDGRRAVQMLKSREVDFIKIQSYVPRDAYFAVADECKKAGITFVGHVPDAIRGAEASNAGQKSFEHLIGIFEGSSTAEDELLKGPKGPAHFLDTYDPQKEAALIALLAKNRTWQCPTLFWERGQWLIDSPELKAEVANDPEAKYAPRYWREKSWPSFTDSIVKTLDTDPLPVREKFVEHELEIVKRLHDASVPLLAGTDTAAGVDVLPGFSLHHELERFVAAGLTPLEALQTATINPAQFMGKTADFGTIAPGKIADLVLLDANPLDDIRNAAKIRAVIADGRYFSRADLDEMLAHIQEYASSH